MDHLDVYKSWQSQADAVSRSATGAVQNEHCSFNRQLAPSSSALTQVQCPPDSRPSLRSAEWNTGDQEYYMASQSPSYGNTYFSPCPSVYVPECLPLHAPVPFPGQQSFLQHNFETLENSSAHSVHASSPLNYDYYGNITPLGEFAPDPLLNFQYTDNVPAGSTFPTPSELLQELTAKNSLPNDYQNGAPETARKARRRAVAESIGFVPTDPDTITSHEKKRHYLECLELYVMHLHEQLDILGVPNINMDRVQSYRGLNSRSIRTLLVHMENKTRLLNMRTLREEQKFIRLRDTLCNTATPSIL